MKKFVYSLLKDVGRIHLKHFGHSRIVVRKQSKDFATNVDIRSEKMLIASINKKFPSHAIMSEETPGRNRRVSDYLWMIDPLDGTVNYNSGIPLFSVVVGLLYRGTCIVGGVYAPYLHEFFYAERGKGAYFNNKKTTVSHNKDFKQSLVHVSFPAFFSSSQWKEGLRITAKIAPHIRGIRALESGSLSSCYVACGRLDGKISLKTVCYDNAATSLIIEEAGGVVSDFEGKKWHLDMKNLLAGNKVTHRNLLKIIRK